MPASSTPVSCRARVELAEPTVAGPNSLLKHEMRLPTRSPVTRRVGLGLVDQAVSSLTNFALVLLVARAVGQREFGAFSLVLVTYQLVLVVSRALVTDPLVVRFSTGDSDRRTRVAEEATGAAIVAAVPVGILMVAAGSFVGDSLGGPMVALGITLPGLLLQDTWRFSFGAAGRPGKAVVNDLVWGVLQLLVIAWLTISYEPAIRDLVLSWGATGCIAGVLGMVQARSTPSLTNSIRWLRENLDVSRMYVAESIASTGGLALALYLISLVAGLSTVGAVRGAQVLFGPVMVLYLSMSLVAAPEAVRLHDRSPDRLKGWVHSLAGLLTLVTIGWSLLLILVPRSVGTELLGATWDASRAVTPLLAIAVAADGFGTSYAMGLRVRGRADRSLFARLAGSPLILIGAGAGAVTAGAKGAAVGLSIGYVTIASLAWFQFRRTSHQ